MQRVAALYLPMWPLDRLRRAERRAQPEGAPLPIEPLRAAADQEQAHACSAPRGGGWRPGARWARDEAGRSPHQRPARHEQGRRELPAEHAFKRLPPDEGGAGPALPRPAPAAAGAPSPRVTSIREGNRVLIAAACPVARAAGVRPGMALTQARVQLPGLEICPADPEGDLEALRRLALALARRWSPGVAFAGADSLFVDLTGVAHLHGGERTMARRLIALLARLGVGARIAIADTPGAAWALAHHVGNRICPPGGQADALAALPIEALRIDAKAAELLHRLGVERIGQLMAMPRAPLVRRFGPGLAARLEQALGNLPEPIDPLIPVEPVAIVQRFAEPIATPEAIAHWLGALVDRLAAALAQAGLGARRIELTADRVDGVPQRIRIGLARPSRDAGHLLRLLARRIEQIEPGYGLDALALRVARAEPLGPEPFAERLDEQAAPDLAPLMDRIATRIGAGALWRTRPVESDVPERSVARAPVLDPPERPGQRSRPDDVRQLVRTPELAPWHAGWPRPARLLRRPERVDHVIAELPDQPPRRFTWRGTAHRVVRADGPERIHGEWWRHASETHSVRDYFRVEDEQGRRYWLFRRGDGERGVTGDLSWYLHGVFG